MARAWVCNVISAGIVGTVLLTLTHPSDAKKSYLTTAKNLYHFDESVNCSLCHTVSGNAKPGKKNLNPFGKEVQARLIEKGDITFALQGAENKDTDGDGATNGEELKLGSSPSDPASKPDPKKLEALRKASAKK
jgi:hypothetical protein